MKFFLIGNYGAGNYGDEAILLTLFQNLSREFPSTLFSVMCADPKKTIAFAPNFYASRQVTFVPFLPFGLRSFGQAIFQNTVKRTLQAYRECDCVILGGGGLFADDESMKAPLLWAYHSRVATYFHKPIFTFGVGVGPISRNLSKWAVSKGLSKASYLGVRDKTSATIAKNILSTDASVSPDPVFLLDKYTLQKEGVSIHIPKNPYIVVSVRPWRVSNIVYKKFAQLYDSIIENFGLKVIFIPFQTHPQNDEVFMNNIIEQMTHREHMMSVKYPLPIHEILAILTNAQACIPMRFHAFLLSLLTNTPCFPIIYSQKTMAFLHDALGEYPHFLDLNTMETLKNDEISTKLTGFLQDRQSVQETFQKANITLKSLVQKSFLRFTGHIKAKLKIPLDRTRTF